MGDAAGITQRPPILLGGERKLNEEMPMAAVRPFLRELARPPAHATKIISLAFQLTTNAQPIQNCKVRFRRIRFHENCLPL
jgi:hypothetical protein